MSLFPEISPVLNRSRHKVRAQVKNVMRFLPDERYEGYCTFLRELKRDEEKQDSTINWILSNYFLYTGFLQLTVYRNKKLVFRAGDEYLSWKTGSERKLDQQFTSRKEYSLTRVFQSSRSGERLLEIEGVVPTTLYELAHHILENELMPIARNFFFFVPGVREERSLDLLTGMEEHFYSVLNAGIGAGNPVTITHFKFQDLSVYFELSGEYFTNSFMEAISETIRKHLKKSDHLIQLSPISYIVISPGARKAQIQQRFENVYFQTSRLVLDYDFDVSTVEKFPVELNKIWKEIGL